MKIRKCFVSNSSTASFVIKVRDYSMDNGKNQFLITKDQIEKLTEYGFQWMRGWPDNLVFSPTEPVKSIDEFEEKEPISLYFDVICNEEDVMEFLFDNKIPFISSVHYDYELVVYKGGDYYEVFTNYPMQYLANNSNEIVEKNFIEKLIPLSHPYMKVYLDPEKNDDTSISSKILLLDKYEKVFAKFAKERLSEEEWNKIEKFLEDVRVKEFFEEIKKIKGF